MKNQMKGHIRILAKSVFTLIPILIISSGCATSLKTVMKSYYGAPTCCESMKDFKFETIMIGDSKSFVLNETSPAYLFDTGKSFFKAFALPQFSYPYHVFVKSYMLGQSPETWYIFFPKVITLNKDFEVVRSTDFRSFQFQRAGVMETAKETFGVMYKIEGHISFTEENNAERYLIILTTDELLGAKTYLVMRKSTPIVFSGYVTAVPTGSKVTAVPHSPSGRINISVLR